jgi:hypothetical protein
LKTHIPQVRGIPGSHDRGNHSERIQPGLASPDQRGEDAQCAHDRRPHNRRVRANKQRIECDADHGDHGAPAGAKQATEEKEEDARDDGDVEAGNGDDVRRARVLERLLQRPREAGVHAEQNARQQRSLGVNEDAVQAVEEL